MARAMPGGATSLKELELSRGLWRVRVSLVEGTRFYVDFVMDIVVACLMFVRRSDMRFRFNKRVRVRRSFAFGPTAPQSIPS
jgi:hypothetical protein